jgi:MoaA/NifB/PqqE/SkfB family radical SAM enzyme
MSRKENKKMTRKTLEQKIPIVFAGRVSDNWQNGVKGWHIQNASVGLYTLDIEHIPEEIVLEHNDPENPESINSRYRQRLCVHNCPNCFNEEEDVYSKGNRILTLDETFGVIDQAREIAKKEGHDFRSIKFLGPGELLMNPQLFKIVGEYQKRKIQLNIFTKGALLGSDELAEKYQGITARELVDRLASYDNVGLLMSFQSFNNELQDSLVTSLDKAGKVTGLEGYSQIQEQALENLFSSRFYNNGMTNRICIVNAPIVPKNIDESFDIYKFFIERATPIVMTPSMLSGKGCGAYSMRKDEKKKFQDKLVELYARIYAYNVEKGVQTNEQIKHEGIASYAGAQPCNQVATGLYIRANGIVQMCPGRFDRETVFANVKNTPLREIWENSPNRRMGLENQKNLVNNKCPAKDGYAFPPDFYSRVMKRHQEILGLVN